MVCSGINFEAKDLPLNWIKSSPIEDQKVSQHRIWNMWSFSLACYMAVYQ